MRFRFGLVLSLLLVSLVAHAQMDERSARAKVLYEEGMAHFQLDEWDQAIESWQAGFRLKPAPQFLYNLAQAYRLAKRPEQALSYYKKYLYNSPKAPNRAEVERHIDELTQQLQAQPSTPPPADGNAMAPPPQTAPPPPADSQGMTPPATTSAPPTEPRADLVTQAPRKQPVTQRKWFWPVVATGAAVVVAGVVVGIVFGTRDNTRTLGAVRF